MMYGWPLPTRLIFWKQQLDLDSNPFSTRNATAVGADPHFRWLRERIRMLRKNASARHAKRRERGNSQALAQEFLVAS